MIACFRIQFQVGNGQQQVPLSGFLSQPGISAPLDKNRLLFNETHTLNGNRMYKWNDDRSLRLQAGYTRELIRQQRGNTLPPNVRDLFLRLR